MRSPEGSTPAEYSTDFFSKNIHRYLIAEPSEIKKIPEQYTEAVEEEILLCVPGLYLTIIPNFEHLSHLPRFAEIKQKAEEAFVNSFSMVDSDYMELVYPELKKALPNFLELVTKIVVQNIEEKPLRLQNLASYWRSHQKEITETEYSLFAKVQNELSEIDSAKVGMKEYLKNYIPEKLYHVTTKENIKKIAESGNVKMSRAFFGPGEMVSLSDNIEHAKSIAMKTQKVPKSDLVVLEIDTSKLDDDEFRVYPGFQEFHYKQEIPAEAYKIIE